MKKRYKIVLNAVIANPDKPFPAGGAYTHLNRIDGAVKYITSAFWLGSDSTVTLDKIIDKGVIDGPEKGS